MRGPESFRCPVTSLALVTERLIQARGQLADHRGDRTAQPVCADRLDGLGSYGLAARPERHATRVDHAYGAPGHQHRGLDRGNWDDPRWQRSRDGEQQVKQRGEAYGDVLRVEDPGGNTAGRGQRLPGAALASAKHRDSGGSGTASGAHEGDRAVD